MISKSCCLIAILCLTPGLCFSMSQANKNDIPVPIEKFSAVITDIDGIKTEGTLIAFNGFTFISGKRGATEIFIPFERIDHIEITDNNSAISAELPWVSLHITLNDQTDLEMSVKSDYEVTGKTSYGQFRVRIDHVKTIDF